MTWMVIPLLAILGTAHILGRTVSYGAAVTSDTLLHLSAALNLLAGEGYREHTGDMVAGWPPLFTMLLAAFGWVGSEPLAAGRWINATAFGLTILAAGLYLHSNLRSRLLALAASVAILTALPLTHFASYCITEPLFVLFTFLALIQLSAFLNRKTDAPLWWAAVFTSLAALTRYPGVVLIGTGVLVLLPLARLWQTLVFGAISSVPLLAVLAYNWTIYKSGGNYDPFLENDLVAEILTEGGGGRGLGSGQSLSAGLSQTAEIFRAWVVPPNAPDEAAYLLWLAVAAVVLAGAAVSCHPNRRQAPEAAPPSFGLGPALLFGVFALTYLVFIIVAVPFTVGHGIPERYLLPIYVPLLLTAVFLLDRFLSSEATGRMAVAQYGLASLVLLGALAHIGYSAHRNLTITAQAYVVGYEKWTYNGSVWEDSEILHYLRDNRINGQIYSNDPYLAWFWDGTKAPGKHHFFPDEIHYFTSTIMEWTDRAGGHILWIRQQKPPYNFDEFDIRVLPGVESVAELADGVVFRVTATEPFDANRHRARKQRYVQQLIERAGELVIHADSTWPISTWGVERAGTDEQVARASWDVYRNGRKLTYRKQPCTPDDVQTNFVLQVRPDDPADLSADRRPAGYDNLDFNFYMHGGVRLDDECVVTAQLPYYPIGHIYIGRWISGNTRMFWEMKAKPFDTNSPTTP